MTAVNLRWLFESQPESAHPVTVIEHSDDAIALFEHGGTILKHTLRPRRGPRDRNLVPGAPPAGFEDREWTGEGVLRVHRPGQPWSTWRWLAPDGTWSRRWYVNLEEPWRRTATGFDSEDWILDIVAEDGSWHYKDEDEFAWAIEVGRFDAAGAERVRAAGRAAAAAIESAAWPFAADWSRWLPPVGVAIPTLLPGWDAACEVSTHSGNLAR